ncbi:ATP-dependent endonuclease [Methylobacter sp. BlB1]|uniref:ATP-dependent nuclease n=1 Tax=unclassified Methylobacter TaxID=2635283 RepID=UPI001895F691|nr:ATP-binding protein [Methylobacter sp. BlB1]MBF6650088.1 AAA family ATPase [Methylobacter sp. BlB1]
MLLKNLEIESFKKIKKVSIDLSNINILVGCNGSGKSSVLQAIHLACCVTRQVDRVELHKTSTISIDDLDYLPTDDYKSLGHKSQWGNVAGSSSSKVKLSFDMPNGGTSISSCTLRSARNAGISITGTVPIPLSNTLRQKKRFFSAYIPGISGIPNKEEKRARKVILKSCSYGDSNVILRNALLLLKLRNQQNIEHIEKWIKEIIGPIKINVHHDDERDLFISCHVETNGTTRPLELIGTGFLQLIQIFTYILLFEPGILLVDEPDIHLHPTAQSKLVKVLARIANDRNLRILLSTHSPFIVRGAPASANVYWLNDGEVGSHNRQQVELALGWGAFGKKIILVSEDSNTSFLQKIVSQWHEIERNVAFYPGTGYSHIPTPSQAKVLAEALGGAYKIVIHRDRDSLTDDEIEVLKAKYSAVGAYLWFPKISDVEAYFCEPDFLINYAGCSEQEADTYIEDILSQHSTPIREQFNKQRAAHNDEIYKHTGGSPSNDEIWDYFQSRLFRGAKGKFIFKQLKNKIPQNVFRESLILDAESLNNIALDLKEMLISVLAD